MIVPIPQGSVVPAPGTRQDIGGRTVGRRTLPLLPTGAHDELAEQPDQLRYEEYANV
jgi:hypothetical protein